MKEDYFKSIFLALLFAVIVFINGCGGSGGISVKMDIGPDGGIITASDGLILTIPPNALSSTVTIEIKSTNAPAGDFNVLSTAYKFLPAGTVFDVPVQISIPFKISTDLVKLFWSKVGDDNSFDMISGTVSESSYQAYVSHFSVGFVGVPANPPDGGVSLRWIPIPAGSYQMGCSPGDATCESYELPAHAVNIPAFDILEHEVTQGEYLAATGENPAANKACGLDCPVEVVTWAQAKLYCQSIGGRLPSESEWEYAARGGTTTKWYCGDNGGCVTDIAWYRDNSNNSTHPVKTKTSNNYGLYDMSGNVWEWVEDDWHNTYDGAPADGSAWIDTPTRNNQRVKRGGSWHHDAASVRSSNRSFLTSTSSYSYLGFRCARGGGGGADAGYDAGEQDSGVLPDAGYDAGEQDSGVLPDAGYDAGEQDSGVLPDAGYDAGIDAGVSLKWILIPAGSYEMGCSPGDSTCDPNELPAHPVNIPAFEMLEHEVTQGEYLAETGTNPACFWECGLDCPVEQVNWSDAKAFCTAVGGRLPSESEWEYAARGGTTTPWYCGDDAGCVADIAWYGEQTLEGTTHPVKTKTANSYGLYDMSGNVWEWVEDDYHINYDGAPDGGSAWIDEYRGNFRVCRGGGWGSLVTSVRSSVRTESYIGSLLDTTGIRCSRGWDGGTDGGESDGGELPDAGGDAGYDAGTDGGFPVTWIPIPAGSYQMGCSPGDSTCDSNELPVHPVNIPAFDIMEHEVTQGEYLAVTGNNPAANKECGLDCPVEEVSWDQAKFYCQLIGGRLPSESEWEYAARGGTTTKWYCGDDEANVEGIAWYNQLVPPISTHQVKMKAANGYGLYDMSGNVHEWVEDDFHANYNGAPDNGSAWINTPDRTIDRMARGGSYADLAWSVRSSSRTSFYLVDLAGNLGFRCSRD